MQHPEQAQRPSPHFSGSNPCGEADPWLAAMRRGDFPAAFAVSDRVLRGRDRAARDDPRLPYHERWVWDGTPVAGRRVLVRCYHGLGDTLQFARFLAPLRALAAEVVLEAQPELLAVLRDVEGPDRLHGFDPAAPLPPSECDIEIMELQHALRLPPSPRPYLRAEALPGVAGRVGFCWHPGGWDAGRAVPAAALRPLVEAVPAVTLQRGPAAAALALDDPLYGVLDVALTARLIAGLAAVVTVDTMVAHLAGALGRPVFLLLKHEPDWRWGKRDGLWYGATRQYRQAAAGDWAPAVRALGRDLLATLDRQSGS